MSSSTQVTQKSPSALSYAIPPIAAAGAIVPVYYGFAAKTAFQLGESWPRMSPFNAIKGGLKVAPTIAATVGMQLAFKKFLEKKLDAGEKASFKTKLFSSTITGFVSIPLLAIFNGQTMGYSWKQSLKALSPEQGAAILGRETAFLASIGGEYPFLSGMLGSALGHPGDTILTRAQKGLKVESFLQAWRGVFPRAVAVGGFSVSYAFFQEKLSALFETR